MITMPETLTRELWYLCSLIIEMGQGLHSHITIISYYAYYAFVNGTLLIWTDRGEQRFYSFAQKVWLFHKIELAKHNPATSNISGIR